MDYVEEMLTNPRSLINTLHNRQGQAAGFHFRIFFVNIDKENFFISAGTIDQILGPRCARVSVPDDTFLILRVTKLFCPGYLELICQYDFHAA